LVVDYAKIKVTREINNTPHYEDSNEELKESEEMKKIILHKKTANDYKENDKISEREEDDKVNELPRKILVDSTTKEKSIIDFYCCLVDNFGITWNSELRESQEGAEYPNVLPLLITTFYDNGIYALICSKSQDKGSFLSENYSMRKFTSPSYDEEVFQDNLNFFLK